MSDKRSTLKPIIRTIQKPGNPEKILQVFREGRKQTNPQRIGNQNALRRLNSNIGSQKTTEPCLQNSDGKRLHASNFTLSQINKKITKQTIKHTSEKLSHLGPRIEVTQR